MSYELKEAQDAKLSQKEDKDQVIDFQECMDKTILNYQPWRDWTVWICSNWENNIMMCWIIPRIMVQHKLMKNLRSCVKLYNTICSSFSWSFWWLYLCTIICTNCESIHSSKWKTGQGFTRRKADNTWRSLRPEKC